MKPDLFGITGLLVGLIAIFLFLAVSTNSTIDTVESFLPVDKEEAWLHLLTNGTIAFGLLGVILGEIAGATYD